MRRDLIVAAAMVLSLLIGARASAAPKPGKAEPRQPIGNNPHPVIWGGAKPRPAAPKQKQSGRHRPDQRGRGRNHSRHGGCYPLFRYYYDITPYYFEPYFGYYFYPPYYVPPWPAPPVEPREDDPPAPRDEDIRGTNARSVALAWKFIGYGDARFSKGEFAEANDRYRKASRSGPQVADAWFRQGFALTASGRYKLAVEAIQRGLAIDPKWSASGFELDELFARDAAAKQTHLDALIRAAEEDPLDADLLFLVGVHLHFDGQSQQADKYFQRARRIAGDRAEHVFAFLGKEAEKR